MTSSSSSKAESTNIWDYKPKWCQPWSIISAGIMVVAASWLVLHIIWFTAGVSLAIVAWWVYFLLLYPKAFAEYITQQNKTSTSL